MDKDFLFDRIAGCLLGMVIGDAIGLPAVDLSPFMVIRKYQYIDGFFNSESEFGKYSFASRLSLLLSSNMISEGTLNKSVVSKSHLSIGPNLPNKYKESILKLASGIDMEECGDVTEEEAWVSIKMIPVGIWASISGASDEDILKTCRLVARITHPKRTCALAGFVIAKVIRDCIRIGANLNHTSELYYRENSLLSRISSFISIAEKKLDNTEKREDSLSLRLGLVASGLQGFFNKIPMRSPMMSAEFVGINGNGNDVYESVPFSLFCFMRQPDDFRSTCEAASMGRQSSVNASLVGAMSGSFHGLSLFPQEIKDSVNNSNKIIDLAEKLSIMKM